MRYYLVIRDIFLASLALVAAPLIAQDAPGTVVFKSGTGDATVAQPVYVKPPRPEIGCDALSLASRAISYGYYDALAVPKQRLDSKLFATALEKYRGYYCAFGRNIGPAVIVVVDFAKHSSQPRLYRVDLRSGDGLDSPIVVAHGIGSDPDNDGYATIFSNVYNSLSSSLRSGASGMSGRTVFRFGSTGWSHRTTRCGCATSWYTAISRSGGAISMRNILRRKDGLAQARVALWSNPISANGYWTRWKMAASFTRAIAANCQSRLSPCRTRM
jgi:L,D-transpeptidase catalytic domain